MRQSEKLQGWVTLAFSIQMAILLMADLILRKSLTAISQRLHEWTYIDIPSIQQKASDSRTLLALLTGTHWLILLGMFLTSISFGLLFLIIKFWAKKESDVIKSNLISL
jgi:hypothetical protein